MNADKYVFNKKAFEELLLRHFPKKPAQPAREQPIQKNDKEIPSIKEGESKKIERIEFKDIVPHIISQTKFTFKFKKPLVKTPIPPDKKLIDELKVLLSKYHNAPITARREILNAITEFCRDILEIWNHTDSTEMESKSEIKKQVNSIKNFLNHHHDNKLNLKKFLSNDGRYLIWSKENTYTKAMKQLNSIIDEIDPCIKMSSRDILMHNN